jgi:hypothetical protein
MHGPYSAVRGNGHFLDGRFARYGLASSLLGGSLGHGRGQARIIVEVEARACPLRQLQKTHGGVGGASVSTARVAYGASGLGAVTAVTDYFSSSPLFFGRRVIDVQVPKRRPPTTALSKKLHSLQSSIRRIIQTRGHSCADPRPTRRLGRG